MLEAFLTTFYLLALFIGALMVIGCVTGLCVRCVDWLINYER